MSSNEAAIEAEIQSKELTAPRVTPDLIDSVIKDEAFMQPTGTTLTVCVLLLKNGFTVTGESAAASPENFDAEIGRKIARENAREKIWALEGYLLKQILHEFTQYPPDLSTAKSKMEVAAQLCHEVNRVWCRLFQDYSQPSWHDAPKWQTESALDGVAFHVANPDAGASSSHDNWMAQKDADGWVYGETKDPEAKTHPCMVPFDELPEDQQIKDRLFKAIVHAVMG